MRAALAAAGLVAVGVGPGLAAEPPVPEALLRAVAAFVAVETGLPAPRELPAVRFEDDAERVRRATEGGATLTGGYAIAALYDPRARVIHLPAGWTGATPAELSVLVHEMTHHLQTAAGLRFACPAEAERAAYAAQARLLELHGGGLEADFALDPLFLLAATTCMP
jgi:hypothetical protein